MWNNEQHGARRRSLGRQNHGSLRIALGAFALALCACEAIVGADFDKAVLRPPASNATAGSGGGCTPGDEQACYEGAASTEGVGVCKAGVRTCSQDAVWGSCAGQVTPGIEDASKPGDESCDGMTGECRWQHRFGDSGQQHVTQIAVNGAGEMFAAGDFDGTLNFGDGNHAGRFYLAKFDSSGATAWSKSFGAGVMTPNFKASGTVAAYPGGGAVMGGAVANGPLDFGGGPLDPGSTARAFVARFNRNGEHVWSHLFSDTASIHLTFAVSAGPIGQIAIAGGCVGSIGLGAQSESCRDWWDAFAVLLNPAGEVRWIKTFGNTGSDTLTALAFDPSGDLIATGVIQDFVAFGDQQVGESGQVTNVVVKLKGGTGEVMWARGLGPFTQDRGALPAVDPKGDIVLSVPLSAPFNFEGSCPVVSEVDGIDFAVVKLDGMGKCLWVRPFKAPGEQTARKVAVDSAGNIVLGGVYYGAVDFGFGEHKLRGKSDAFLLKLSPAGQPLWSRSFGDASDAEGTAEQVNGLDVDAAGNIYVAGSFDGAVDFCDNTVPMQSAGAADIYIANYAP